MTHPRTLALALAVVAMLGAPILQPSAEAQGRGGGRGATDSRGGGRTGGRAGLAPRTGGRRVAPAPRPASRAAGAPQRGGRVVAPRRGGRVVAPRRGGVVIGGYYQPRFYPSFYSPFYNRFYSPFYSPWSPYRYGGYAGYRAGQFYGPQSALRLQVSPRNTEVFVNGYYTGIVDDFDGIFQRLRLESGEYELALYLPGHQTVTQQLLLSPDRTLSVKHVMVPLGPTDPPAPRPVATGLQPSRELPAPAAGGGGADLDVSFGAITIRVQPADAEVLIDGERWEGPANDEALILQIAPGPHRIEVRKEGYRGYTTQIDVRAGHTAPINVSLPRQ